MEAIIQTPNIPQEKIDFLMETEYLMEQMAHAHIPLEEGFEKLRVLIHKAPKD